MLAPRGLIKGVVKISVLCCSGMVLPPVEHQMQKGYNICCTNIFFKDKSHGKCFYKCLFPLLVQKYLMESKPLKILSLRVKASKFKKYCSILHFKNVGLGLVLPF